MLNKFLKKKDANSEEANGKVKTKKRGGFLELDEKEEIKVAAEAAPVEVATTVVAQAVSVAKETIAEVVETTKESAKETITDVVETTKETVKGKTKGKTIKTETAPKPASDTQWDQPEWVKVMYKNTTVEASSQPKSFASENMLPTPTTSRRRPGPSLNKFMDMARQVKTSRNKG